MGSSFWVNLFVVMGIALACQASSVPEQFHIALAGSGAMSVTWFTASSTATSECRYGTSADNLNLVATGSQRAYHQDYGFHHTTELTGLDASTKYFYSCGDGVSMSRTFSFTNAPSISDTSKPFSMAVFGDMGYGNSTQRPMGLLGHVIYTVREWSAQYSRDLMEQWKDNNEIDMVWHIGDIGYADDAAFYSIKSMLSLQYENVQNGYMNWLESLASTIPYHVVVGNHESECWDPECILHPDALGIPLSNFSAYNARWHMPSSHSGGTQNMWYSFDYGAVHFTAIDTETDFEGARLENRGPIFPCGHFASDGVFASWLENDLIAASQNPDIKWLIVGGHRNMNDLPENIVSLFSKYGVSLYLGGHIHSYARYAPVNGVTQILIGGPGCDDMQYSTDNPNATVVSTPMKPTNNCTQWAMEQEAASESPFKIDKDRRQDWSTICRGLGDEDTYFTNAYSIGKLTIADNGHGDQLNFELYSSVDGSVLDAVTISSNRK